MALMMFTVNAENERSLHEVVFSATWYAESNDEPSSYEP